jgi:hypothetical protein
MEDDSDRIIILFLKKSEESLSFSFSFFLSIALPSSLGVGRIAFFLLCSLFYHGKPPIPANFRRCRRLGIAVVLCCGCAELLAG